MPNRPRQVILPVAVLSALVAAGCSSGVAPGGATSSSAGSAVSAHYPVEIVNCGVTITLKEAPRRVVAPSLPGLEATIAMGQVDRIVGTAGVINNLLPEYRAEAEAASLQVISDGGFPPPTKEAVLAVDPDFIVSGYEFDFNPDALGDRQALHENGLQSYLSEGACDGATMSDALSDVRNYGQIFGVPERAKDIADRIQAQIDSAPVAKNNPKVLVIQGDPAKPTAQGSQSMAADMVARAGGKFLFPEVAALGELSWEKIIEAEPEVIVVASTAAAPGAETIKWIKAYDPAAHLPAVVNNRMIEVPLNDLMPGVRTGDAYVKIASAIAQ